MGATISYAIAQSVSIVTVAFPILGRIRNDAALPDQGPSFLLKASMLVCYFGIAFPRFAALAQEWTTNLRVILSFYRIEVH